MLTSRRTRRRPKSSKTWRRSARSTSADATSLSRGPRLDPIGESADFIVELENGFKIYHMGVTGLFGDMKLIGEYYRPDLVLIPIGGHFVPSPADAAYATNHYLKPRFAIPMHDGTNPILQGTPAEYLRASGQTSTKVYDLKSGDSLRF
jgi:L-ascorbate metabolism protein UlaG (beta-lactamase superfamily)